MTLLGRGVKRMLQPSFDEIEVKPANRPEALVEAAPWDQLAKHQQIADVCRMFDAAIEAKSPNSKTPNYSLEAKELLRDACMIASQMRNRVVTRDHLIVALLRASPPVSLNAILATGRTKAYDDESLLAGALVRISGILPVPYHDAGPRLTDSQAQYDDVENEFSDDTAVDDSPSNEPLLRDPLLRWTVGASDIAHSSNEQLRPGHFVTFATNRTDRTNRALKAGLMAIAAIGRPSRVSEEAVSFKKSVQTTINNDRKKVIEEAKAVMAQLAPLVVLEGALTSGLGKVNSNLATLTRQIEEQSEPKPIFDPQPMGEQFIEFHAKLNEIADRLPRRPTAWLLAALIFGAIVCGGAAGFLIRCYSSGDPALAAFAQFVGL
jgi:hypothetical protein